MTTTSSNIASNDVIKINSFYITIDERAKFTPAGISSEATDDKPYKLNIARIDRTSYGFELRLMNPKNRDLQGHLKIIKNGYSHVTQIKFRTTMTDAEHTYFIQPTPEDQNTLDGKFFTHQEDHDGRSMEEFVDKKLYPFVSIEHHNLKDYRILKRIYPSDNIDITFEERMDQSDKKVARSLGSRFRYIDEMTPINDNDDFKLP